ncbi:hypothetical protein ABT063_18730 [Streptomyces sp. NPDC002838]|uniref:hypothetical protein n=1 Tax=Streptomyces sp. NPDC002838 TaxID=3154436 RepID=UPI00332E91F8
MYAMFDETGAAAQQIPLFFARVLGAASRVVGVVLPDSAALPVEDPDLDGGLAVER